MSYSIPVYKRLVFLNLDRCSADALPRLITPMPTSQPQSLPSPVGTLATAGAAWLRRRRLHVSARELQLFDSRHVYIAADRQEKQGRHTDRYLVSPRLGRCPAA
jgi:hypothetical protein